MVLPLICISANQRETGHHHKESHLRQSTESPASGRVVAGVSPLIRRRVVGALLFAGLWLMLAFIRPTTTFHLAPLIVTAWLPVGEQDPWRALAMAGWGLSMAVATILVLSLGGALQGPSLLPQGGPAVESTVAALLGVAIGVAPALLRRARETRS